MNLEEQLNLILNELFTNLEDGIEINYHPGCVPVESDECLAQGISDAEKIRKINLILELEPLVATVVDSLSEKRGGEIMGEINKILIQRRGNNEYSGNQLIVADLIILRIRMNLGSEAYLQGVQDSLALNNLFDIAVGVGTGYGATKIVEELIKKYPDKFATKLGSKAIPVVGWGLTAFMIGYTGVHTAEYIVACYGTEKVEGELPEYYCGKLTVNGILLFAGVGASKVNFPGIYNFRSNLIAKLDYSKVSQDMINRGWTESDIINTIRKPFKEGKSIDYISDNINGQPATAYFISDNQYIVVNNSSGFIVQISNRNISDWDVDNRIYDIINY